MRKTVHGRSKSDESVDVRFPIREDGCVLDVTAVLESKALLLAKNITPNQPTEDNIPQRTLQFSPCLLLILLLVPTVRLERAGSHSRSDQHELADQYNKLVV